MPTGPHPPRTPHPLRRRLAPCPAPTRFLALLLAALLFGLALGHAATPAHAQSTPSAPPAPGSPAAAPAPSAARPSPAENPSVVEIEELRAGRGEAIKAAVKVKKLPPGSSGVRFRLQVPDDVKGAGFKGIAPAGGPIVSVDAKEAPTGSWDVVLTWEPLSTTYSGTVATLNFTAPNRIIRRHAVPITDTQVLLGPGKGGPIAAIQPTLAVSLISNDIVLFTYLSSLVALIFALSRIKALQKFFHYLPPLIWMYFLPMFSTTLGITPDTATLYDPFMSRVLLPAVLVLLLVPSDVRGIMKLGFKPLILMCLATVSIVIGAVVSFAIFRTIMPESIPHGTWKALSALSGSWIGGSSNMMAVFISLDAPPGLLGPIVVVDTVVAYTWLGMLIALSSYQKSLDARHGANSAVVEELAARVEAESKAAARAPVTADIALMIGIAFLTGQACIAIGAPIATAINSRWPEMASVLSGFAWGILLMTVVGLVFSMTPLRKLDACGASALGNTGLYLLLTSYGARANLTAVAEVPVFFGIAAVWLLIHAIMLYGFMRLLKAPLFLASTSSMANIGGTASAPVVAAAYYPSMAPVGLLLAIVGGILGTPVALFIVAFALRRIAGE